MSTCEYCQFRPLASCNTSFCSSWLCRLLGKVRKADSGCWIWTGSVNKKTGHGKFQHGKKTLLVHRASYQFFVGQIPDGMIVLHAEHEVCGSRLCINPLHLRVGTLADNQQDRKRDKTDCSGRSQYMAYPKELVEKAIAMRASGVPNLHIARQIGVNDSTVRAWVKGVSRRGNKVI